MKAIVTGGAGFIGSHIAERLIRDGHEVIVIDNMSSGKEENVPNGCKLSYVDICLLSSKDSKLFKGCDVIFHNAASKKNICLKNPVRDLEVNGAATLGLLQIAVNHNIPKFIHASTGSVYGEVSGMITEETPRNPVSYYGISKCAGESYVQYYSRYLNTTVLRYFHVYGRRQENDPELGGVVAIFEKQIREGRPITIHGDGSQKRVFTFVEDVVEANIQAWQNEKAKGQVYNCASDKQISIKELAYKIMGKHHRTVRIDYADPLEGDIHNFEVSSRKIKELGVTFRHYEPGLHYTCCR